MALTFSSEQEELRTVVRKFMAVHSSEAQVRGQMDATSGYDAALWKLMAEQLGIQSLVIPEEYGGAGFGFDELSVVLEEAGRSLLCAPLLSTVMATYAILFSDDDAAASAHLPGIAGGTTVATVAVLERSGRWTDDGIAVRADADGERYRLSGAKHYVLDGADADLIVVAARTAGGVSLFTVDVHDPGVTVTPLETLDRTRRQANFTFTGAPATLLGAPDQGWATLSRVLDVAAAALACEQVGGAAQVLETTVDYVKTRQQFGRAIGSFQAVKHRLADMLVELESARSAAYFAATAVTTNSDELPVVASMAKAYCSTAYYHVAAESIQLHGGIGFTWEHSAHLYFKRAKGSEILLGSPTFHRELIAQRIGM